MELPRDLRPRLHPLAALAAGALLLAAAVLLARAWLPEWVPQRLSGPSFYIGLFERSTRQAGIPLEGRIAVELVASSKALAAEPGAARKAAPAVRAAAGAGLRVQVSQSARLPGEDLVRLIMVQYTPAGRPVLVMLPYAEWKGMMPRQIADPEVLARIVTRLLLAPGEELEAPSRTDSGFSFLLRGAHELAHAETTVTPNNGLISATRVAGPPAPPPDIVQPGQIAIGVFKALVYFAAIALFLVFLFRRRIGMVNGLILAAGCLLLLVPAVLSQSSLAWDETIDLGVAVFATAIVMILWSTAESGFRSLEPGLVTGLDSLRLGRLGPRGGSALLGGAALGAGLAALLLGFAVLATALPGTWPRTTSLSLPVFQTDGNPLLSAVLDAAWITLLLAVARRWLHGNWALLAAAVALTLFRPALTLHPFPFELAANFILFAPLVVLLRRGGLAALLAATLVFHFSRATAFAGLQLAWLPATFGVCAALLAALVAAGWIGLRRPAAAEGEAAKPPAFIRRLEEERRVKYEMDLLVRMQLGLLPQELPSLPGWQIAARSLLATEASGDLYDFLQDEEGQLWVAAGDVAGHGYSCSILQAMTSAALGSLIGPGKLPSEVLLRVDQVLRRRSSRRLFTSLALLRLDPQTGSALLANAGHPFPFFLRTPGGEIAEVALPGLPLGQGPSRAYLDEPIQLPPGSLLVFCSDGLFEAIGDNPLPYGYDRPREVLQEASGETAAEVLEKLLADWRRHLGATPPPDDTTVVVIKRL